MKTIAKDEFAATRIFTHDDLEKFPENEIWELLEGVPCQMAPPSIRHQAISMELSRQFANYLIEKGNPCRIYAAPFGVYLPNTRRKNNFVSPDLTLVCEAMGEDKYYGVPSLVIEIVSPSNKPSEQQKKFEIYQTVGIREYWTVYPDINKVSVFELNPNNRYELVSVYDLDDEEKDPQVKVGRFDDLWIDFRLVFR